MRSSVFKGLAAVGAACVVALGGCASQGGSGDESQGVTEDTIKLGTTLPLTGGAASVAGQAYKSAFDAVVAEVNENGGIGGRQVEFVMLDDALVPSRTVSNIRRLGDEDKVFGLVMPIGSAALQGAWDYIEEKNLPTFGPVLPPNPDIEPVYMLGTSHENQGRVIVDVLQEQGLESVGVIQNDNDLGNEIAEGVKGQAEAVGMDFVGSEFIEPGSTDVSAATMNMRNLDPDAVVFGTDSGTAALVINHGSELDWNPRWAGDSSTASAGGPHLFQVSGDAAVGTYGTMITELPSADTPEVAEYRDVMERRAPDQVDSSFALQAYATFMIFKHVVESVDGDLTPATFATAAQELNGYETGLLPPITFGEMPGGRDGTTGAMVIEIGEDGQWKQVSDGFIEPTN